METPPSTLSPPGPGWYPASITGGEILWQFLGSADFAEPFFHDTLRRHRHAAQCRTPLAVLRDIPAADTAPPAAFIFHASRCGSTLLMQMLARLPACRCLSEPPALDGLLAQLCVAPSDDKLPMLRGLIHSFGQPQHGVRHIVLKPDSWHLSALPLLQRAFPGVPCWFLHRDPAGILRSHRRERGSQMVPGLQNLAPFGIQLEDIPIHDLDARTVAVLTAIFRSAAEHIAAGRLRPLAGTSLPEAISSEWLAQHGLPATPQEIQRLQDRAAFHGKNSLQSWQPEPDIAPDDTPGLAELRGLWRSFAE